MHSRITVFIPITLGIVVVRALCPFEVVDEPHRIFEDAQREGVGVEEIVEHTANHIEVIVRF